MEFVPLNVALAVEFDSHDWLFGDRFETGWRGHDLIDVVVM
jgi:hypothetical protein